MVGQDQDGARRGSPADLANPHPDQRAENAMVQMGDGALQPQIECHADQLRWQQHQRECDESQSD